MPMNPRLLRPKASGQANTSFLPSSISGMLVWFDADDATTIAQNSDGTGAAGNDDPVGYWGDKSGNGVHATQSVNLNRPAAKSALWNGKRAILFDGADDFLETAVAIDAASTRDLTLCIVADVSAGNGNFFTLKRDNGDDYITGLAIDYGLANSTAMQLTFGRGAGSTLGDYADRYFSFTGASARFVIVWELSGSDGTLSVSINGTDLTQDITAGSGNLPTGDFLLTGSGLHRAFIGARGWAADNTATRWHGGHIAEIVVYDSILSPNNLSALTSHMIGKWGIE
jgi:hypothetical protein